MVENRNKIENWIERIFSADDDLIEIKNQYGLSAEYQLIRYDLRFILEEEEEYGIDNGNYREFILEKVSSYIARPQFHCRCLSDFFLWRILAAEALPLAREMEGRWLADRTMLYVRRERQQTRKFAFGVLLGAVFFAGSDWARPFIGDASDTFVYARYFIYLLLALCAWKNIVSKSVLVKIIAPLNLIIAEVKSGVYDSATIERRLLALEKTRLYFAPSGLSVCSVVYILLQLPRSSIRERING